MTPAFNPRKYKVEIKKRMVTGAILFEGSAAELPGVTVDGTSEAATLADDFYQLSRWHAVAFPDAVRAPLDVWERRRGPNRKQGNS